MRSGPPKRHTHTNLFVLQELFVLPPAMESCRGLTGFWSKFTTRAAALNLSLPAVGRPVLVGATYPLPVRPGDEKPKQRPTS